MTQTKIRFLYVLITGLVVEVGEIRRLALGGFALALLCAILLRGLPAHSLPSTAWTDIWSFPGTLMEAHGVTIGGDYVYVVGTIDYGDDTADVVVQKYDLEGNLEWAKRYNFFDYDKGIGISYSSGKVFVTGWSADKGEPRDTIVMCIGEDGAKIWSAVWGAPDREDLAKDIVARGPYVYVLVQVIAPGAVLEGWVLKYDLSGNLLGEASGLEVALDLYVYGDKVYVAGSHEDKPAIAVYDTDLNLIALEPLDLGDVEMLTGICVAEEGGEEYMYVIGNAPPSAVLVKLNANLDLVWVVGVGNCDLEDIALHMGFPVAVGYIKTEEGDKDFLLLKVSPTNGELMYEQIWGGDDHDYLYGVAPRLKYVYVVGKSYSYAPSLCGVVWCWNTAHVLEVKLPYDQLSWLVFHEDFELPVGGGVGTSASELPEGVYTVIVEESHEEDGVKWVFEEWSDGVKDNPREISLFEDVTLTAHYKTLYKIVVESEYGTAKGTGWYELGAAVEISVEPTEVPLGEGKVAVFKGWERDGEFISAQPTLVVGVSGPAVYKAVWEIVTVQMYAVTASSPYGEVSGSGMYEAGSVATVSVSPTIVDHGNGTRRIFKGWLAGGQLVSAEPTYSFEVDSDVSLKAAWETQYLVTVHSEYGEVSGGGWYSKGSAATISIEPTKIETEEGTLEFAGWYLEDQLVSTEASYSFVVDEPKEFVAKWTLKAMCEVVLVSDYGTPSGAGTYPEGSIVEISISPTYYEVEEGERYVFIGWYFENGTPASKTPAFRLKVTSDVKLVARWILEYRVEVHSDFGETKGEGWYRPGSKTTVAVEPVEVEKDGEVYVFKEWVDEHGNTVTSSPSFTYTVEEPAVFVAKWERKAVAPGIPTTEALTLLLLLLLVIAVAAALLARRRRPWESRPSGAS